MQLLQQVLRAVPGDVPLVLSLDLLPHVARRLLGPGLTAPPPAEGGAAPAPTPDAAPAPAAAPSPVDDQAEMDLREAMLSLLLQLTPVQEARQGLMVSGCRDKINGGASGCPDKIKGG